jgi:hypothetical protein
MHIQICEQETLLDSENNNSISTTAVYPTYSQICIPDIVKHSNIPIILYFIP